MGNVLDPSKPTSFSADNIDTMWPGWYLMSGASSIVLFFLRNKSRLKRSGGPKKMNLFARYYKESHTIHIRSPHSLWPFRQLHPHLSQGLVDGFPRRRHFWEHQTEIRSSSMRTPACIIEYDDKNITWPLRKRPKVPTSWNSHFTSWKYTLKVVTIFEPMDISTKGWTNCIAPHVERGRSAGKHLGPKPMRFMM